MSDKFVGIGVGVRKRLKDMNDGTHAEVVALGSSPAGQFVKSLADTTPGTGFHTPPNLTFDPAGAAATSTLQAASVIVSAPGTGHVPGDTLPLAGGTETTQAVAAVATTKVVSATVASGHAGSGGTTGAAIVTGTTGTGTKFQADVVIAAGAITSVTDILVAGSYTANPSAIANEPVTGGGLTGAQLSVVMGVATTTVNTAGVYSAVPANPVAQGTSSGAGVAATFALQWGIGPCTVTNGGFYDSATTPTVTPDGAGTGAALTPTMQTIEQRGGFPTDYCNGGGTLPGTTTTLAANMNRRYLRIQNDDTTAVGVAVASLKKSDGTATTTTFNLKVASAAGAGDGGFVDFNQDNYVPLGAIVVTGTSGKKAIILEG